MPLPKEECRIWPPEGIPQHKLYLSTCNVEFGHMVVNTGNTSSRYVVTLYFKELLVYILRPFTIRERTEIE